MSESSSREPSSRSGRRLRRRVRALWRLDKTRRFLLRAGAAFLVVTLIGLAWALAPFWRLSGQFDDVPQLQPSRLYARAPVVAVGETWSDDALETLLESQGYRGLEDGEPFAQGRWRWRGEGGERRFEIFLRSYPLPVVARPGGAVPASASVVSVGRRGRRVTTLAVTGASGEAIERPAVALEPAVLASFHGDDLKERRPVVVDEVPEVLVDAVLAAEDSGFFSHPGLSASGIARALWVNLRGGEVRQGGSTLTQQLVKNLYLTHERTVGRKVREAVLAVFLELRYSKRSILQAYLNEIYLGSRNGVNLIGVGSASRAFFGKDAAQLDLAEAATLAGMIRSPASYDPVSRPGEARERRDQVIDHMVRLGWVEEAEAEAARARPVWTAGEPVVRHRAPYFADWAAQEAARRFGVADLDDTGHQLFSTLDPDQQRLAEEAVGWGLEALENGWEKGRDREGRGPLQAALVSVDPESGAVLAWVGGRDWRASQFDRVSQARRQAGSAFKPVVYATALERQEVGPATLLEDEPLSVRLAGRLWEPGNDDGEYRGWVTARVALEDSLNVPTARLALATGLPAVVETARGLGVTAPLEPVPALALGAFEVTPLEMATVYATLAAGGVRPPVHGLVAVEDRAGESLEAGALPEPERVLSPQAAYQLTAMLQGVFDRGTATAARSWGLSDPLAGKSGTSNDRRDCWFAGYAPRRATVVWVGYDDNSPTRMSGTRGALPLWTRFMVRARPAGGWDDFRRPGGLVTATIDPETGELATDDCPRVLTEVFRLDQVPREVCYLHASWWDRRRGPDRDDPDFDGDGDEGDDDRPSAFRRWLDRVFGDDRDDEAGDGETEERREGDEGDGGASDGGDGVVGEAPGPDDRRRELLRESKRRLGAVASEDGDSGAAASVDGAAETRAADESWRLRREPPAA